MVKCRVQPRARQGQRKRSRIACSGCHHRKIRCDVTTRGSPCTSCHFYDVPCLIPLDRREKSARLIKQAALVDDPGDVREDSHDLDANPSMEMGDQPPEYWIRSAARNSETLDDTPSLGEQSTNQCKWLPEYASPLSLSISSDDYKILQKEGVFDVPDEKTRTELLRSYVQFVHPVLPVLNLEDFFIHIDQSYPGSRGVSFLLFQAVMFAATAFQTAESLALDGFRDRREARKTRFQRLKMLYSFGGEDDRMCVLQAVLLMTYWDDDSDDDAWRFVGVAKAISQSIDANPTAAELDIIKYQRGLWNRISWSCYIRDRLIALRTRRPFQIEETSYTKPMLGLSDFETGPLSTKCFLGSDGSHPAIRDPSTRTLLSQATIALAQYCKCITRILECQYTVCGEEQGLENESPKSLIPRRPAATSAEVLLWDSELEEWRNSLPQPLILLPSGPLGKIKRHSEVILHFRTLLNGIYNLASSTLHRPQLDVTCSALPELVELSKCRVHYAASAITEAYTVSKKVGPDCMLSDVHVSMLEVAIITHFAELESTSSPARQLSMENFQCCAQALRQLGNTYPSADIALTFLDAAVRKRTSPIQNRPIGDHADDKLSPISNDPMPDFGYTETPETPSPPTLAQQIERLNPPQMSNLLCSHFMMTTSEKSLLQGLVNISDHDQDRPSRDYDEISSGSSTPSQTQTSPTESLSYPHIAYGNLSVQEFNSGHETLNWQDVSELFPTSPSVPDDSLNPWMHRDGGTDDWNVFQMFTQCME